MYELPTALVPPDDDIELTPELDLERASRLDDVQVQPAPTLITEQEVLFGTAAAVRAPSTRLWTRATRVVAVAMRRISTASSEDLRPQQRHYPPRLAFVEDARMAREMDRL